MAADIINLNRARKAKARAEKAQNAEENRILHGARKAQRNLAKARTDKARRDLDAHKKD